MSTKISMLHPKPMLTLGFYTEYQKKILDEYKYENALKQITAFYETTDNNVFIRFEDFSFNPSNNPQVTGKLFNINGLLVHYSTIEGFEQLKNIDTVLKEIEDNSTKYNFILFIYGDLKTFLFRYRFVLLHNKNVEYKIKKVSIENPNEELKKLIDEHTEKNNNIVNEHYYYLLNDNTILLNDLTTTQTSIPTLIKNSLYENQKETITEIIINKSQNKYITLSLENIKLIPIKDKISELKEAYQKLEIITVDLKQMFNSESIAENAVDLNINLMKWRMCPGLNTQIIKEKKYLLIGSGTLGCHVSRCLLGWGARNITFMDNGKVSYSNPVRQSLYNFNDSTSENYKAILAPKKLKEIFPLTNSNGFNINIPLPGRTLIDEKSKEEYIKNLTLLEEQIKLHDIIFLLTDSRESRWYPTLIAKAYNKIVITAAIGFDSFLIMRHGNNENKLGCYFCTDIVTPSDTSGSRTLDQQCTISRPGVSMICSGLAIELGMSCINASLNKGNSDLDYPHQIRGNLIDYNMNCFRFNGNKNCVACSDNMIKAYLEKRDEFLVNVMNDPYYIEKTSGVQELIKNMKIEDNINDGDDF
jgi:ubiquitin-like modifier-activating enzyme ATG7